MENLSLSEEQNTALASLAESANARLETIAAASSSQAFNVGCSVGLMPGLFTVALVFFLSRGSIAAAAIAFLLVCLFLVLFANVVAYISRSKAIDRAYQDEINLEIELSLREGSFSRNTFEQAAGQVLPAEAALRKYLTTLQPKAENKEEIS